MTNRATIIVAALLTAAATSVSAWTPATTERVSVGRNGVESNNDSLFPAISAHGRFVAFDSYATNLVPNDTNGQPDAFVHDRQSGRTTRVSVGSGGAQGNGYSYNQGISADGRFVVFRSEASNLVADDTNGEQDVFVRDRQTGRTTRVSVGTDGEQGNGYSQVARISADGRFVAFESNATNLVPNDTNGQPDVFVRDRQTGRTTRVSLDTDGAQFAASSFPTAISPHGRYVGFNISPARGFWQAFLHDRQTGRTTRLSVGIGGKRANNNVFIDGISLHGRFVVLTSIASNLVPDDTNGEQDVFVRDRQTGRTTRVSVGSGGAEADAGSIGGGISADGRYVTFDSNASNLVPGDTNDTGDVFVHDRQTGRTTRVSVTARGAQANANSQSPAISADGRFVAFLSYASNLVPRDTNGVADVFLATRR